MHFKKNYTHDIHIQELNNTIFQMEKPNQLFYKQTFVCIKLNWRVKMD